MMPAVLQAQDLVKTYGTGETGFTALDGVNLAIGAGESVAVVGKSGSGKSTLMHLLALLDAPTSGSVLLHGAPTAAMTARELNRVRNSSFGFVFQQFFLTPGQTVLENVVLPLKIAGVGKADRRRRGLAVLERLDMAEKAHSRAIDLSGGQKQRVAIARALVNDPAVIFADEPTGNLDSVTGAVVQDILFDLHRDRGITLVVVTHDAELAAQCERQVHLRDGRILQSPVPARPGPEEGPTGAGDGVAIGAVGGGVR
ncbi:ABC transporter ATP-binding protein [Kocuria oxytropis]|uniref:ABC transporter ATP-binding protein n=1 Tax=Kocuria oxytropis TaxID=3058913 RepID=UPI003F6795FC